MQLTDILTLDCTQCAVQDASKKKILETVSQLIAPKLAGISRHEVFENLLQRERLGSTGIGLGIAIPHGRLEKATRPVAVLLTVQSPVDFDAIDNQPVDIVFALLVPENEPEQHLQTLSDVARKLNNKDCCRGLRKSTNDKELYQLFVEENGVCS